MRPFIFDFNGTLFQDTEIHRRAWKRFMARYGFHITDETFDRYMCGPTNRVILAHFFGDQLAEAEYDRLSAEKEAVYRDIVLADPTLQKLTPGAPQMLDTLAEHHIPCAIATASIRENVDFYMDVLQIRRWFDYGHIFFDAGSLPGKPDPAIYRMAMKKLGFPRDQTTVVEDSMAGIQSASGAGIRHIIAIDTTLGPDAFRGIPNVVAVIHDFCDFKEFIDE